MPASIRLTNLTIAYNRQPAVHHVNGEFKPGALTAITGPNGAGKSTLLKAIAGILTQHEGSIEFIGASRKDIAYLPQAADIQRDFPISVLQMVSSGFWQQSGGFGRISTAQKTRALEAIQAVGLATFEHRTLDSLSMGQFQRAQFARIIVQDSPLILLDEPFAAIDEHTLHALLAILASWQADSRTVICVLHDMQQIKTHFSQCLLIAREPVAWGPAGEVLTPDNLIRAQFFHETPEIVKAQV